MRDYEILYIVRPDLDEAEVGEAAKKIESLIESVGGSVQKTNVWGKRRLAYEVAHLREGHYVLTDFQIEAARVPEMEATLRISDQVFRHLIVRKPEVKAPVAQPAPPPVAEPAVTEPAAEPPAEGASAEKGATAEKEEEKVDGKPE